MPDGGEFRVDLETIPNNRIRIIFEDTGIGMTPGSGRAAFRAVLKFDDRRDRPRPVHRLSDR